MAGQTQTLFKEKISQNWTPTGQLAPECRPSFWLSTPLFNNSGSKSCKKWWYERSLFPNLPSLLPDFFLLLPERSLTSVMHSCARLHTVVSPEARAINNQHMSALRRTPMLYAHTARAQTGTAWFLNLRSLLGISQFAYCLRGTFLCCCSLFLFFLPIWVSPSPQENKQAIICIP